MIRFNKKETFRIISKMREQISNIEMDIDDNELSEFQKSWQRLHDLNNLLLSTGMSEIKKDIEGK